MNNASALSMPDEPQNAAGSHETAPQNKLVNDPGIIVGRHAVDIEQIGATHDQPKAVWIPQLLSPETLEYFKTVSLEDLEKAGILRRTKIIGDMSGLQFPKPYEETLPKFVLDELQKISMHFAEAAHGTPISFNLIDRLGRIAGDFQTDSMHFESYINKAERALRFFVAVSNKKRHRMTSKGFIEDDVETEFVDIGPNEHGESLTEEAIIELNELRHDFHTMGKSERCAPYKGFIRHTNTGDGLALWGLSQQHSNVRKDGLLHRTHPDRMIRSPNGGFSRINLTWHATVLDSNAHPEINDERQDSLQFDDLVANGLECRASPK